VPTPGTVITAGLFLIWRGKNQQSLSINAALKRFDTVYA
jgi:hypothetical protein